MFRVFERMHLTDLLRDELDGVARDQCGSGRQRGEYLHTQDQMQVRKRQKQPKSKWACSPWCSWPIHTLPPTLSQK